MVSNETGLVWSQVKGALSKPVIFQVGGTHAEGEDGIPVFRVSLLLVVRGEFHRTLMILLGCMIDCALYILCSDNPVGLQGHPVDVHWIVFHERSAPQCITSGNTRSPGRPLAKTTCQFYLHPANGCPDIFEMQILVLYGFPVEKRHQGEVLRMLMQGGYSREKEVRVIVSDSSYTQFVDCTALRDFAEDSQILFLVRAVKMDETKEHSRGFLVFKEGVSELIFAQSLLITFNETSYLPLIIFKNRKIKNMFGQDRTLLVTALQG